MYHHLTVVCELKLISAALIHFLQTFERLNKSGITQSRESFRNIMDDLGSNLSSIIIRKLRRVKLCYYEANFNVLHGPYTCA